MKHMLAAAVLSISAMLFASEPANACSRNCYAAYNARTEAYRPARQEMLHKRQAYTHHQSYARDEERMIVRPARHVGHRHHVHHARHHYRHAVPVATYAPPVSYARQVCWVRTSPVYNASRDIVNVRQDRVCR